MARGGGRVTVRLTPGGIVSGIRGASQRMLIQKAHQVAVLARANSVGNGSIPEGIVVGPLSTDGKSIKVISTNPHTVLVHNGSRPHVIRPRRRRSNTGNGPPYLRFEIGGRVVYARMVNHPGYKGNPFLTDALRQAR